MSINIPDSIPDTDYVMYEGDTMTLVLVGDHYDYDSSVQILLTIGPHERFDSIIPDDKIHCDMYDDSRNPSTTSDLPDEYYAKFMRAVELIETEFNLEREHTNEGHGTCMHCSCGQDNRLEQLSFGIFLR